MSTDYTTKYNTAIGPLGNKIPGTVEEGSDGELRMSVVLRSSDGVELFTPTNPIAAEIDGGATSALQETGNSTLSALLSNLATIINKIIAAPATEAKQDTANTALGTIATNTDAGATELTMAAILAALADPATQTTLAAVLAKLSSDPATATLQTTGNTKLDSIISVLTGYLKQVNYNSSGTEILTETDPGVFKIGSAGIIIPTDKQAVYRHLEIDYTTPITGSGAYTSSAIDGLTLRRVTGTVYADQAGELHFEHSKDGTNWRRTRSITIVASTPQTFDEPFYSRYQRLVYANGATAQGAFELVAYSAAE
jgi:uncharacterized protein YjgD (DUF1641 family)